MSSKKSTIDKKFAERLVELIDERLRISRTKFAKNVNITSGYLSMITTGKRGPSADLLAGIFLNYSEHFEWLLTGNEKRKNKKIKNSICQEIDDWINHLTINDPNRPTWFKTQFEDSFPMFKEWRKRKEEENSQVTDLAGSKVA
jgi:transcriptional regulator with XRE-family HTH domain